MSQVTEEIVSMVMNELNRYSISWDRITVRNGLEGYWSDKEALVGYLGRKELDNFTIIKILNMREKGKDNYVRESYEEPSSTVTDMVCSGNCVAHCNR